MPNNTPWFDPHISSDYAESGPRPDGLWQVIVKYSDNIDVLAPALGAQVEVLNEFCAILDAARGYPEAVRLSIIVDGRLDAWLPAAEEVAERTGSPGVHIPIKIGAKERCALK